MKEKALVPQIEDQSNILGSIAGELSERSIRIYTGDAVHFATWLQERGITPERLDRQAMTDYRAHLVSSYAPATAKRMFSVARRLLDEQVVNGVIPVNPAKTVKGVKADDDSPHIALEKEQAKKLLSVIDQNTLKGKRDYAMIITLLYTGLRRFELAALMIGDMGMEQGHHILTVQAGKGKRRDVIKLRVEAWRAITTYLDATKRADKKAPLFCQFRRWDAPVEAPISSNVVYRTVLAYAKATKIPELEEHLKPHGMRASFVTLALEGGAKLEQVQIAARHKDPRTTERYWRRKLNLDNNAVDKLPFLAREE